MTSRHHEQSTLNFEHPNLEQEQNRPVECLGMTFPNEEERRKHFLEKLREKLKDLEFRKIEGFPIGSDEDILALSDPPYYTACPNPFIADFIKGEKLGTGMKLSLSTTGMGSRVCSCFNASFVNLVLMISYHASWSPHRCRRRAASYYLPWD